MSIRTTKAKKFNQSKIEFMPPRVNPAAFFWANVPCLSSVSINKFLIVLGIFFDLPVFDCRILKSGALVIHVNMIQTLAMAVVTYYLGVWIRS